MADKDSVIIKKVKKGGHGGHHGGGWKVAYADFVTAMMAFFLLMWLLSSTPQEKLHGISDYFTPTMGLKDAAGIGFEGGNTPMEEGKQKGEYTNNAVIFGAPPSGAVVKVESSSSNIQETEAKNFTQLQSDLYKAIHDNPELKEFRENILIEQTPDGLRIQLLDKEKRPMFVPGTSALEPYTKKILGQIAKIIRYLPNYIAITGHTTASRYQNDVKYDNWELSADRANSTRRYLISASMDPEQISKIIGRADQEPLDPVHPENVQNMRVAILLLRNAILPYQKQVAPDGGLK